MISGMESQTAESPTPGIASAPGSRRLPVVLAGLAGGLFLVVAGSMPPSSSVSTFSYLPAPVGWSGPSSLQVWLYLAVPAAATVLGLCLLRWWPYLLVAAALMVVPEIVLELNIDIGEPFTVSLLPDAGYYLAIIALMACAQQLVRTAMGWCAVLAALLVGSRLVGSVIPNGTSWYASPTSAAAWHVTLLVVGLAGVAPAVWEFRRASGPAEPWSRQRVRLVAVGTLAAAVPIPLSLLTTQRLASLLGVTESALFRHQSAQTALIGAVTMVAVALLAAVAGRWLLAGALVAALVQVAVVAPINLAVSALGLNDPVRWVAALAGAALGAVIAGSRWRFPLAATLSVLTAAALLIAYAATTGDPEKLALQHAVVPGFLLLVLSGGAAAATVGATAAVLAPRGALPVVLGPLVGVLTAGGLQTIQATDTLSVSVGYHLNIAAVLLPVAGAGIGSLGFAQLLATRRAERKQAEQIRLEAAAAERDRLARPIHDGVLQVLALVQRHGSELGDRGSRLAELAGEQEVALRSLLTGGAAGVGRDAAQDLRGLLQALATPAVEVIIPAQPVVLSAAAAAELVAAIRAALDNVQQHAGPAARAWVLVEDERDGVRVTVRDDGVGFAPQRMDEAAEAGRLGIAQSMRGRISDLGGTTTIESRLGEGTEVEFWVPRARGGA
jgi:signal transduction histidine kinase